MLTRDGGKILDYGFKVTWTAQGWLECLTVLVLENGKLRIYLN